jgi:hypothetical protein
MKQKKKKWMTGKTRKIQAIHIMIDNIPGRCRRFDVETSYTVRDKQYEKKSLCFDFAYAVPGCKRL